MILFCNPVCVYVYIRYVRSSLAVVVFVMIKSEVKVSPKPILQWRI